MSSMRSVPVVAVRRRSPVLLPLLLAVCLASLVPFASGQGGVPVPVPATEVPTYEPTVEPTYEPTSEEEDTNSTKTFEPTYEPTAEVTDPADPAAPVPVPVPDPVPGPGPGPAEPVPVPVPVPVPATPAPVVSTITPTTTIQTTVNYTDPYDSTLLMGYAVVPAQAIENAGGGGQEQGRPVVIILPDWDNVNEYELTRARMFAEQHGWATFAADLYGLDNHQPTTFEDKAALATALRSDPDMFNSRIAAAIEAAKMVPGVDPAKGVAVVGYCVGGSGSMNYALSGYDDLDAAVAFHGSLSNVEAANAEASSPNNTDTDTAVNAKVLILSGGEDTQDSTASVIAIEDAYNAGNNLWELTRYSDVEHGFTKFDTDNYNPYVDRRSWTSCVSFLEEVFEEISLQNYADKIIPDAADVDVTPVQYTDTTDGGTELKGFVSYPPSASSDAGGAPQPAVIIIPDADGPTIYEKTRAQMIATDLGYVGFVADVFGINSAYDTTVTEDRNAQVQLYQDDVELTIGRLKAAIKAVRDDPLVDPTKVALIGYSFGGTAVLNYALAGEDDGGAVAAVVSFHGGLANIVPPPVGGEPIINVRMNVQSGADDDTGSAVERLEGSMKAGGALWEYTRYEGAKQGFTNFNKADRYDLRADVRSWKSVKTFLRRSFALSSDTLRPTSMVEDEARPVGAPTATVAEPTPAPSALAEDGGTDPVVPEDQVDTAANTTVPAPTVAPGGGAVPPPTVGPTTVAPDPEPAPVPSGGVRSVLFSPGCAFYYIGSVLATAAVSSLLL